ncbi:hypothetical protein Vretimale_5315 [Volvox reticuliferus]|uniref:Uncharacterized protein n=1 Tax=Volvox reticuliferus TaxID=1737510 RepID=A0A8J4DHS1_9CHLO|nr:hypothetical protein Vretifemale_3924 [Volvox reticuliferus]GIM00139.1 hypothetical protein Vretimale_5315 [Volvox reticuliferus]
MGLLLSLEQPDPGPRTSEPRVVLSWLAFCAGTLLCIKAIRGQHAYFQMVIAITLLLVGCLGLLAVPASVARSRLRTLAVALCCSGLYACQLAGLLDRVRPEALIGGFLLLVAMIWRLLGGGGAHTYPQGATPVTVMQPDNRLHPVREKKAD